RLLQQRKVLGLILLGGGLVLLILAFVIGVTHKADGSLGLNYGSFGEALGLLLLALATLGAGAGLQPAPDADATPILQGLLALVFGSLSLARTDVRSNPSLRRLLFGYNDLFLGLLVLELLIVLNILIYALVPYSFQWTESGGIYAMSPATKNLLANLKKETH